MLRLHPHDAESLLRYQNYSKRVLDTNSNGEDEALLERSESYLTGAFSRQIKRVQEEKGCSEEEATLSLFKELKPKSLDEVESLRKMIESVNSAKQTKLESDDSLKEMYPKTYMFSKVTEILQKK